MKKLLAILKHYLAFVAIGSFFSTVEEFLTIVAVDRQMVRFIFTTIIVWPVVLTIVYGISRLFDLCFKSERSREIAHFVAFGGIGLLTEWFLMAPHLAPWAMIGKSSLPFILTVLLVLGFQMGMCAFWTTVTTAPRLFLNPDENHRRTRKRVLRFYIPFFVATYIIVFAIPHESRTGPTILLILLGYLVVNAIMISTWILRQPASAISDETSRDLLHGKPNPAS